MGVDAIGYRGTWLWELATLLLFAGIVVVIIWAVGASLKRSGDDEAGALLRARFARGEIDGGAFEAARQALEAARQDRGRRPLPLIVGAVLIALAIVAALFAVALRPVVTRLPLDAAPGPGILGPRVDGDPGVRPTPKVPSPGPTRPAAPTGASVRIVDLRFEPASVRVAVGGAVRWVNGDSVVHAISAADGSWR